MPIAGSAAAVVAGGAFATVAQAAPAAPEADAGSFGSLAGAQGAFESCEAYFGFGKELVAFDVVDQNGADGVAHAVPDDTQVVFHLEDEDGDVLECTPVPLDEGDWNDFADNGPSGNIPAYPGDDHFVYPSIDNGEEIDEGDFGTVETVGFRVVGNPAGHTLVSPTGAVDLLQSQLDGEALFFNELTDPRTNAHLTGAVGAAAAAAWDEAVAACDDGDPDLSGDDDLLDAVAAIEDLTGNDIGGVDCGGVGFLNLAASVQLGVEESIAYTEAITLSLPVQATSTTVAPTSTSAAVSPATATTVRVLARTGAPRSASLPVAVVGVACIGAGALVLGARRLVRTSR